MGRLGSELKRLFSGSGEPDASELQAMLAGTKLGDESLFDEQLVQQLRQLGKTIAGPADTRLVDQARRLLDSARLSDRLRGLRLLRDEMARGFTRAAELPDAELVRQAVQRLGAGPLQLDPVVALGYQRHLRRSGAPGQALPFERWLRKTESRAVRERLRALGLDAWLRGLSPQGVLHAPARAMPRIDAETLASLARHFDEMDVAIKRVAGVVVEPELLRQLMLDKLLRKMAPVLDGQPAAGARLMALFQRDRLTLDLPAAGSKVFNRGHLSNLQSNLGEICALPLQIGRLVEQMRQARPGERLLLATDVRFGQTRLIVQDAGPRSRSGAHSSPQPAIEREFAGLEYSDDLIVDVGSPPRLRIADHHENKVTQQAIEDALFQFADNPERVEFAARLSIGRLYEVVDGRLQAVDPAQLGRGRWSVEGGRLVVAEPPGAREKLLELRAELDQRLAAIEADTGLDAAGRRQALAELLGQAAFAEKQHQRLLGLHSATRAAFVPGDAVGTVPPHIELVRMEQTYDSLVALANLLLLQGPFR